MIPFFVGESNIDNLCGWAGDLQTLTLDVIRLTPNSIDGDLIYNTALILLGDEDYSFSTPDINSDTDAVNIKNIIDYNDVKATFENYYSNGYLSRITTFLNGKTNYQIYQIALDYTDGWYGGIAKLPLMEEVDVSSLHAISCAQAYADYFEYLKSNE